jgi:hypothetical protein
VLLDLGGEEKGPVGHTAVGKNKFCSCYDYLKHAGSDPNDTHDFPPRANELALWDCLGALRRIFGGLSVYMGTFSSFFTLHLSPEIPDLRKEAAIFLSNGVTVEEAGALNRLEFFAKLSEMFGSELADPQKA